MPEGKAKELDPETKRNFRAGAFGWILRNALPHARVEPGFRIRVTPKDAESIVLEACERILEEFVAWLGKVPKEERLKRAPELGSELIKILNKVPPMEVRADRVVEFNGRRLRVAFHGSIDRGEYWERWDATMVFVLRGSLFVWELRPEEDVRLLARPADYEVSVLWVVVPSVVRVKVDSGDYKRFLELVGNSAENVLRLIGFEELPEYTRTEGKIEESPLTQIKPMEEKEEGW